MNTSYKIALLVAGLLFVGGVAYYAMSAGDDDAAPEPESETTDVAASTPPPPPEPTTSARDNTNRPGLLRTPGNAAPGNTAPERTAAPSANRSTATNTPRTTGDSNNDFLNDLRARMAAANQSGESNTGTNAAPPADDDAVTATPPTDSPTAAANDPTFGAGPDTAAPGSAASNVGSTTSTDTRNTANTPTSPPTSAFGSTTTNTTTARPTSTTPPIRATNPNTETRAATTASRTYSVQPGDTLSSIARRVYGEERRWVEIAQANPRVDPIRLKVGQELRLPAASSFTDTTDEDDDAPPAGVLTYTVRPGDTLSAIANQFYNDPNLWRPIFNANRERLGANPNRVQAGMRLVIPPAPQRAE